MAYIIHVITTIENGGAEKQLLTLAYEQIKTGNTVEIIPLKGKFELKTSFIEIGAIVNTRFSNFNPILQVVALKFYLRKNIFEKAVIHAHLPRAELISYFGINRQKFFVTRHNSELFFPNSTKLLSSFLSRMVINKANACIAISQAVKDFILVNNEANDYGKIHVVHYGFMQNRSVPKQFKGKRSDSLIVGTIARLEPQKDLLTLLKAISRLKNLIPSIQLQIVGSGSQLRILQAKAQELGIENLVTWVGKIENVSKFLANLDIFILSTNYEGFGLVLLEAMQNKLPILASNNSSIPEVLGRNSESLFTTGDDNQLALKILEMKDESNRRYLIKSNYSRLKLFDPRKMNNKILDIYSR